MQCKECGSLNSWLFKEPHDVAVLKNSYKSRLYELISASPGGLRPHQALSRLGAIIIHILMPSWLIRPIATQWRY